MNDEKYIEVSLKDLEALMLAASVVRNVYNAVDAHKNDVAVNRTSSNVAEAISNASKRISDARRIKDPMEDEPPTEAEIEFLVSIASPYNLESYSLENYIEPNPSPQNPMAISLLRKRLIVMGHFTGTIHWGDKTQQIRTSDRVMYKLTERGERFAFQ